MLLKIKIFILLYISNIGYSKSYKVSVTAEEYNCITNETEDRNALTFITPLSEGFIKTENAYITSNNIIYDENKNIDCYFNNSCFSKFWYENISIGQIGVAPFHEIAPVIHTKWNNLTYTSTKRPIYLKSYVRSISFSIRTKDEFSLLLCDIKGKCFWITMNDKNNGTNNQSKISVSYCSNVDSIYTNKADSYCSETTYGKNVTLSENIWSHFTITNINGNKNDPISIIELGNRKIIEFFQDVLRITTIQVFQSNTLGLFKMHKYNFLSLNSIANNGKQQIGPNLTADENGSLCLELQAVICETCSLEFSVEGTNISETFRGVSKQSLQPWQYVKLITKVQPKRKFQLSINAFGYKYGFWGIDNIRQCHENERYMIKMKKDTLNISTITCSKLSIPIFNETTDTKFVFKQNINLNLQVYSRDENFISVRWQSPSENSQNTSYEIIQAKCSFNDYDKLEFTTVDNSSCSLWPDWNCFTFTDIAAKDCVKVYVRLKNGENSKHVQETFIESYNNKTSDPPRKLVTNWINSDLMVCWKYPNFTKGGLIYFQINIKQIKTDLIYNNSFKTITFNITDIMKLEYCYVFTEHFPLSSTYKISMLTRSKNDYSEKIEVEINNNPVPIQLLGTVQKGFRNKTVQEILLPAAESSTITYSSSIYILVCEPTSNAKIRNENKFHLKLRQRAQCNGLSWVAAQLKVKNITRTFAIGDFSKGDFKNKNVPTINDALNPYLSYDISIFFINEYKAQEEWIIIYVKSTANEHEILPKIAVAVIIPVYAVLFIAIILCLVRLICRNKSDAKGSYHKIENRFSTGFISDIKSSNSMENGYLKPISNSHIEKYSTIYFINEHSKLIEVNELSNYITQSLKNEELQNQYKMMPKGFQKSYEYGKRTENQFKNRYTNLTAYDHSRVILTKINEDPYSDFINANYIHGYNSKKKYIATQRPKSNTINDFWRMIWQEKVHYIIALDYFKDSKQNKIEQYWPNIKDSKQFGNIFVTFITADCYSDFEIRYFDVEYLGETRKVQQLHFTSWPDHELPAHPEKLVLFVKKITNITNRDEIIVVHCSAGIGRTGTIILIDICFQMAQKEQKIDAFKYFSQMREQRVNMIDTFEQYALVHIILLELLSPYNFQINHNIQNICQNLKNEEYLIKQREHLEKIFLFSKTLIKNNKNKPTPSILENGKLYNTVYSGIRNNTQEINVFEIDSYKSKKQFMVIQNPSEIKISNFWKLISDNNVEVIVAFAGFYSCKKMQQKLWSNKSEEILIAANLFLKFESVKIGNHYDMFQFYLFTKNNKNHKKTLITIFEWKLWNTKATNEFLKLLKDVEKLKESLHPIVVTCFDDLTTSSLFVTLSFLIETIRLEKSYNVCQALQMMQRHCDKFRIDLKQFQFIYDIIVTYTMNLS